MKLFELSRISCYYRKQCIDSNTHTHTNDRSLNFSEHNEEEKIKFASGKRYQDKLIFK